MATYVGEEIYNVITADQSAETIAAGGMSNTSITSAVLSASGTVIAKLFVWSMPTELIPITLPIPFN